MPPFRWEDIDHSLVNLKLSESAEDMHRKIKEDERRIQFENRHNLNDGAVPSLVLRMKQKYVDARAQQVYETYCDVWQKQGQVKSADFVRAVFARAIKAAIRARARAIAGEFLRFATRTSFPAKIRDAHLLAHRLEMQRLETRWARRLEAEAKECKHAERIEILSSQNSSTPSSATKLSPEPSENVSADKIQREGILKKVGNPQTFTVLLVLEAARYFEVTPHTIYRWVQERKLTRGVVAGQSPSNRFCGG
jgi:hypothetical protein